MIARGAGVEALMVAVAMAACGASQSAPARAGEDTFCPTLPKTASGGFLIHGARMLDGERELPPADVLVSGGEVVAVGPGICFRAVGGSIAFVDGRGATLLPLVPAPDRSKIEPGMAADLMLKVEGTASGTADAGTADGSYVRAAWKRGVPQSVPSVPQIPQR